MVCLQASYWAVCLQGESEGLGPLSGTKISETNVELYGMHKLLHHHKTMARIYLLMPLIQQGFGETTVEFSTYMSNYTPQKILGVINCPCHNLCYTMSSKETPGKLFIGENNKVCGGYRMAV